MKLKKLMLLLIVATTVLSGCQSKTDSECCKNMNMKKDHTMKDHDKKDKKKDCKESDKKKDEKKSETTKESK